MSIKDWKNNEITQLLSEAWGFKFNTLQEFNEFSEGADKNTGMSGVDGDDDDDTYMGHVKEEELGELAQATKRGERRKPHQRKPVPDEEEELMETGAEDTGASKGDKGKDKDDPSAKDYTDGGDRKGDESKTHKGEKDYTTKKDDELKTSGKGRGEKKGDKAYINEDSGEEEGHHYDDNRMSDDDHIKAIEHHLDALRHDRDYDDDHIDEGGAANRVGNEEKDNGRNRMHADRVHEQSDPLREAIRAVLAKHLKG